jgi:L-alanine-DL-glutamate epimerase-like enolase superfamily enzyme
MKVRGFEARVFETPLKRPFVTALGRKTTTHNVGLTLRLSDGSLGYGEASASLAKAHLSPARLLKETTRLARACVGREAEPRGLLPQELGPASSAFECALIDAWTRSRGLTIRRWLGGALSRLETDATISAVPPEAAAAAVREARGFKILKVKLGAGDDEGRLKAVRRAAPKARLILDGNQGLTLRSALKFAAVPGVELLEQPLKADDWKGMAALCRRSPVPVAADEMVQSPGDMRRVLETGAATAVNVKLAKSGLLRSLEIAAMARAAGLPLMIGCMAESARGLSPSVQLALGTGWFKWADLDSDWLLAGQSYEGLGWRRLRCSLEAREAAR